MAHRLISSCRQLDRILKRTIVSGNINSVQVIITFLFCIFPNSMMLTFDFLFKFQIQRKFPDLHRFLSEVKIYFSADKPPKGFEKYFKPKTGEKTAKAPGEKQPSGTASEAKKPPIAEPAPGPSRASSGGTPRPPGDPWSSFLGGGSPRPPPGGGAGGGAGGKPSGGLGSEGGDRLIFLAVVGTIGLLGTFAYYEMSYKEITWKDFVNR